MAAVLAMAASASAAEEFHSEAAHTILAGEQSEGTDEVWTFNAGTVTCKTTTYSGTTSVVTTGEVRLTPTFGECTAFGFVSTSVHPDNCALTVGYKGATIQLTCGLIVTAFNCFVRVGAQILKKVGSWINKGVGTLRRWVNSWEITGVTYTQESRSFPGCSSGTFTNGTWRGAAEVRGANTTGASLGIWYE